MRCRRSSACTGCCDRPSPIWPCSRRCSRWPARWGAAIHGGYDLANAINTPDERLDLPSQIDPRGLLTFGLGGLALLVFAPLLARAEEMPRGLAPLALALGIVLVALYVLRLVVLDADNAAIVTTAALAGFVLSPLWYVRLGLSLWRAESRPRALA